MTENVVKWINALRSGEFRQTQNRLRDVNGGYCCLGVACELFRRETGSADWTPPDPRYGPLDSMMFLGNDLNLPTPVQEWLGLASQDGDYGREGRCLAVDNDEGRAFTEIADIIENEPEGLFV